MALHKDRILYVDDDILIVNKLPHELAVAASGQGKLPLVDFLRKDYPGIRVLHRLDFGTSGVIAFARNAEVVRRVRESKFAGWVKTYHALVAGKMQQRSGTITRKLPARSGEVDVEAITHYRTLLLSPDATYVEVRIDTGRKHQIRQHFAMIGHPLLLDPLYGDKKKDKTFIRKYGYRRFFLHAHTLELPHPMTGKVIRASAPLPQAFREAVDRLRAR